MAKNLAFGPDDTSAAVDAGESGNRSAYTLDGARDASKRICREREDTELSRILDLNAVNDQALLAEFADTVADGL